MKHWSDIIWKLALALVGFGIGAQVAWALIKPLIPMFVAVVAISLVVWAIIRLRHYYSSGSGGHQNSLIRGR